jgi:hypothetical protein
LTRPARSRSIGSRSKGCGRARVKRGRRADQMRQISIRRSRTRASGWAAAGDGRRRRPVESGGGTRRRPQSRAPVPDSTRERPLCNARRAADRSRAATRAEVRRRGRSARRCGARTPATGLGRRGARGCQQAAPGSSSPSCEAPGRSHGDEAAAEPGNSGGGALGFRRLAARARGARRRLGWGRPGGGGGL